jgi:hypothetical protein
MLVNNLLLPLLLTIVIELTVAYLMGYKDKQSLQIVVIVNVMTNPFVNFITMVLAYFDLNEFLYWFILPLELLLIPIEWMILNYAIPHKRKAFLKLSAAMNISSFVIGLLIL